jgi:hypothetical protein
MIFSYFGDNNNKKKRNKSKTNMSKVLYITVRNSISIKKSFKSWMFWTNLILVKNRDQERKSSATFYK